MKRGTPRHPKMWRLAEALGVPIHAAVGIMEMLWHFAAEATPQGDIGSAKDQQILEAVNWKKKTPDLMSALVSERWLDPDPQYRLVVHDWPDHADNSVKKWLQRHEKEFLPVYRKSSRQCLSECLDTVYPSREDRQGLEVLNLENLKIPFVPANVKVWPPWAADGWDQFEKLWKKPCECCNLEFPWRQEDNGMRLLISWVFDGKFTEQDFMEVIAGLTLWRSSKDWHEKDGKYVQSVAKWIADKRWKDRPAQKGAYD